MSSAPPRVVAFLLLMLLLPVLAVIALLVLAVFGRPVLFRQVRVGLRGEQFELVKYRTMTVHCDSATGDLFPDDQRQRPFGRLLRRLRLDELPELVNIVRGDMSFVGPRPLLPATVAGMGVPGLRRCSVRPGLTGWAQVSGNTLLTNQEKLDLDLWYVEHRSLALDLLILARTPAMLLLGERRYGRRLADAQARLNSR